ncbi:hypothetical protein V6N11_034132 [Hibiscus sabdariffa]|uniref:GT-1/4-like C-terminal domain-containing protein n=1 Tax=Hibiscus sabdariffa TaxID=183260 RepID=A0ABR2S1L1_9ROSI
MELHVEVVSEEIVKPSSSTPDQLRCYQISFIDQLTLSQYNSFIYFYPETCDTDTDADKITISDRLKQSISKSLTHFSCHAEPMSMEAFFTARLCARASGAPFDTKDPSCFEDAGISYGPVEASGRPTLNLERRLDHDGHPLAIAAAAADAVAASGVPPWNWRETPGNGGDCQAYGGRVITIKFGDYTRRIGIDGTADAIREAIKSAFRLRTKRAFWLEDEDHIVRSLDREMPVGNYTLHIDEGLAIKVCLYDESDHIPVHTEDKIFYVEDDYREYLARRGYTGLREIDGYRNIDNMDDLRTNDSEMVTEAKQGAYNFISMSQKCMWQLPHLHLPYQSSMVMAIAINKLYT